MKIPPFKLERWFAKYEFKASNLLCSSDCETMTTQELLDYEPSSQQAYLQQRLGYTESLGSPELRQEIAKLYNQINADNVLVHAGAEEAIFNFLNVALEPGDHIIAHFPAYQSLYEVAQSIGCEVTKWQTKEADNWELDLDFLKDNIKENTKLIILNTPHNPTGYLMDKEKFLKIMEIARNHNILVLSDEVYRFLEYDNKDRLPAACDVYDKAISIGVMSKTFGLAGLRIGWVATRNQDIYNKMAFFKDYTSICNSAPSELLATIALKHYEDIAQRNKDIIFANLKVLNEFFARHQDQFSWTQPKAGSIAFPGLITERDAEEFCTDVVEKKGVLLMPSNYYDYGNRNFRVGFGRKNMPEAVERFEDYLLGR